MLVALMKMMHCAVREPIFLPYVLDRFHLVTLYILVNLNVNENKLFDFTVKANG
jgi:hypothetical protein